MKILIIGLSHVGAIRNGLIRRPVQDDVEFIQLKLPQFSPNIDDSGNINSSIISDVDRSLAAGVDLIVSATGNNRHNAIGLVKHPRPFDFVCETEPDLPLLDGHELVPRALVRERLRREIGDRTAIVLKALRERTATPIVHLETPPPLGDEEFLVANAGVFRQWIAARGLSHRLVRYKLWREASAIYRETCAELAIGVLPPPRGTQDKSGFLFPKYASGATHGSKHYGIKVLDQVLANFSAKVSV